MSLLFTPDLLNHCDSKRNLTSLNSAVNTDGVLCDRCLEYVWIPVPFHHLVESAKEPIHNTVCSLSLDQVISSTRSNKIIWYYYRPISLFSKIFGKVIYKRLFDHLNNNAILDEHQFGFQSEMSTENASHILLNLWSIREVLQLSKIIFKWKISNSDFKS
jgi:hypothetical protein